MHGSKHFVQEPTIPLSRIKAMMNFDMIGRYEADRFSIFGAYTAREFADWVKEHEAALGFEAKKPREVPPNSDHSPFAEACIPVLFPFTGLHEDYHRPSDDFDKIDAEAATRVLEFGCRMLTTIASAPAAPTPTYDEPAEEDDGDADTLTRRRPRVRLGFFPKLDAPEPGVFVERVVSGGPGAVAGLKVRDQITKIGATEIKTMADYRAATAELSPGDEVEMQVLREGATVTLTVKFTAIPSRREPT